jgi:hypothetical protein
MTQSPRHGVGEGMRGGVGGAPGDDVVGPDEQGAILTDAAAFG